MPTPASVLYTSIAARIASDPAKLGLATFLSVAPILADYTPGLGLLIGGVTLGAGTLNHIDATVVPVSGLDPVTGQYKILVPPPAGGWKWAYDAVTPAPPQSIYGYALIDATTHAILFAVTDKLQPPILLNVASLVILDEFSFLMLAPPMQ